MTNVRFTPRPRRVLRFDCTSCGGCCSEPIALITSEDVRRIIHHTGLRARDFVHFYRPQDVEMPARDDSWIRTRYGKRALGLAKVRGPRCTFLGKGDLCRIHEVKPLLCRMYPFKPVSPNREPVQFTFPRSEPCQAKREGRVRLEPLRIVYQAYSDSHWAYLEELESWHRETRGRGTPRGFLRFVGLE